MDCSYRRPRAISRATGKVTSASPSLPARGWYCNSAVAWLSQDGRKQVHYLQREPYQKELFPRMKVCKEVGKALELKKQRCKQWKTTEVG